MTWTRVEIDAARCTVGGTDSPAGRVRAHVHPLGGGRRKGGGVVAAELTLQQQCRSRVRSQEWRQRNRTAATSPCRLERGPLGAATMALVLPVRPVRRMMAVPITGLGVEVRMSSCDAAGG